jgi:hypothetical protein
MESEYLYGERDTCSQHCRKRSGNEVSLDELSAILISCHITIWMETVQAFVRRWCGLGYDRMTKYRDPEQILFY